jgi:hypothetical protein
MSTTGARSGLSRAAAQLTDKHISGNRVPRRPFVDILIANGVRQFRNGLISCVREPRLSQQIDYFLPAVLHQNNLLAEAERLRLTLKGYDSLRSRGEGPPGPMPLTCPCHGVIAAGRPA